MRSTSSRVSSPSRRPPCEQNDSAGSSQSHRFRSIADASEWEASAMGAGARLGQWLAERIARFASDAVGLFWGHACAREAALGRAHRSGGVAGEKVQRLRLGTGLRDSDAVITHQAVHELRYKQYAWQAALVSRPGAHTRARSLCRGGSHDERSALHGRGRAEERSRVRWLFIGPSSSPEGRIAQHRLTDNRVGFSETPQARSLSWARSPKSESTGSPDRSLRNTRKIRRRRRVRRAGVSWRSRAR